MLTETTMPSAEHLKQLVRGKLEAAAEEIFAVFHRAIVDYEEELARHRKFFAAARKQVVKIHGTVVPPQVAIKEKVIVEDQAPLNQDKNSSQDQEEPEPPQPEEHQEEVSSLELRLKQEPEELQLCSAEVEKIKGEDQSVDWHSEESDVKMLVITSVGSEANSDLQLCSPSAGVSTTGTKKEELPQQVVIKEEVIVEDQAPLNQDKNSSQDQEEPEPPQLEEHQEEESSLELRLKQEPKELQLCSEESDVKVVVITSVGSEASSDLQMRCLSAGVSMNGTQKEGDQGFESEIVTQRPHGKNRCVSPTEKCVSSSPGTSFQQKVFPTAKNPYVCQECGRSFSLKSTLNRHKTEMHTSERPHVCQTCGKNFKRLAALKRHKIVHTAKKPYVCNKCDMSCTTLENLQRHKTIHSSERPHVCQTCLKTFKSLSNLKRHKTVHTVKTPYVCNTCGKGFISQRALTSHKTSHASERPYVCQTCLKTFKTQSSFKRHKTVHTVKRPYVCYTCGKGFISQRALTSHKKIHTGEKQYGRDTLNTRFLRPESSKRHKHSIQLTRNMFVTCAKKFVIQSDLNSHKRIHKAEKLSVSDTC